MQKARTRRHRERARPWHRLQSSLRGRNQKERDRKGDDSCGKSAISDRMSPRALVFAFQTLELALVAVRRGKGMDIAARRNVFPLRDLKLRAPKVRGQVQRPRPTTEPCSPFKTKPVLAKQKNHCHESGYPSTEFPSLMANRTLSDVTLIAIEKSYQDLAAESI